MTKKKLLLSAMVVLVLLQAVVVPVAAQEGTTTPTPTTTPTETDTGTSTATPSNDSGDGQTTTSTPPADGSSDSGDDGDEKNSTAPTIDLSIRQPSYVTSSVSTSKVNGVNVYEVSGEKAYLKPQLGENETITDWSIQNPASIRYDKGQGVYVVDFSETTGTFKASFTVSTADGSNEVRVAYLKAEQANYRFLSQSEYDEMFKYSQFGRTVEDKFEDFCDGVDSCRELIEGEVFPAYLFFQNPLAALTGSITAIVTLLLFKPGGWFIIGLGVLALGFSKYRDRKQIRKLRRQFRDRGEIEVEKLRQNVRDRKRMLVETTYQDMGLSDYRAEALEDVLGDNPKTGIETLQSQLTETTVIGIILSAYGQLGYKIRKDDDDTELVQTEYADGAEYVAPSEATEADILDLDWSNLDTGALWEEDVDSSELMLESEVISAHPSEGDLVDELGVKIKSDGSQYAHFDTREEFAETLAFIIKKVASSEYTDEEGRIRPEMDLIETLWLLTAQGAEKYRMSLWDYRDVIGRTRDMLSPSEQLQNQASEISSGKR